MEFEQQDGANGGQFIMTENGAAIGRLDYSWAGPEKLTIDYVAVNPRFEGKGYGRSLVKEVVRYARENNFKVRPYCGFARVVFKRDKELDDIVF